MTDDLDEKRNTSVVSPVSSMMNLLAGQWDQVTPDFTHVLIVLGIIWISTRVMRVGLGHIFALLAAYLIIDALRKRERESSLSFNQEMDYRLDMLGAPSHFHTDINIVNLFYSIYGWRERNAYNFDHAIKATNNVLQIEFESGLKLQRCVDNYEVAQDQRNIALNMMHGFIYSLDHPLLVTKLKRVLQRLQELLEKHMVIIQKHCEKFENDKDGVDIHSRFIEDAHGPKPYDGSKMSQFDYY
jgi:hypothetical protein